MNVLVACEESQAVCKAFRAKGHNAFSCDLKECSGGHPEWHIRGNVHYVVIPTNYGNPYDIKGIDFCTEDYELHSVPKWDLVIAHPPCTYLSKVATRHLYLGGVLNEDRYQKGLDAREFFMFFYNLDVKYLCIENPVPFRIFNLPRPSQVVQPFDFGHSFSKKTYLWLKNLPPLFSTEIIPDYVSYHATCHGSVARSKTFSGIAEAMAEQWGCLE